MNFISFYQKKMGSMSWLMRKLHGLPAGQTSTSFSYPDECADIQHCHSRCWIFGNIWLLIGAIYQFWAKPQCCRIPITVIWAFCELQHLCDISLFYSETLRHKSTIYMLFVLADPQSSLPEIYSLFLPNLLWMVYDDTLWRKLPWESVHF